MLFGLYLKAMSNLISVDGFGWMIFHCEGALLCILTFVYSY